MRRRDFITLLGGANRSKAPSCEAMGTEGADPVLKIKTAPVFEPLLKPLGAAADQSRAV
jgi:hypothetical protein